MMGERKGDFGEIVDFTVDFDMNKETQKDSPQEDRPDRDDYPFPPAPQEQVVPREEEKPNYPPIPPFGTEVPPLPSIRDSGQDEYEN